MMSQSARIIQRQALAASQLPETFHPVVRRVLANRQITQTQQIDTSLQSLPPPSMMKGMQQAVERLWQALQKQEKIMIVGDFDADGATSVALLMLGLQQLGFAHLQFEVPDRFQYGYGLSEAIVELVARQKPQLIITVDTGIASFAGVDRANQLGIDVLLTDHHLPAEKLPKACAILNPNQPDCCFPSKALAGVGVAFYLLMGLRAFLREQQWFAQSQRAEPNLAQLLDLVALGTVADVVPLDQLNRALVTQGIQRIRAGYTRPGIKSLLNVAGKDIRYLASSDLGFAVGPRLNAAGRLDDMAQGIMLLITESEDLAQDLALSLDEFNQERRVLQQTMQEQADAQIQQLTLDSEHLPMGVCLYNPDWHQGVVGLVASKVKEQLNRPVIAFAQAEQGLLKGSGRSIAGVHLRDVLDAIATQYPDLLDKFGGHAMAAGLTIEQEKLPLFEQAFAQQIQQFDASLFASQIFSDGEVDAQSLNMFVAQQLRDIPWGQSLPEPVFEGVFFIHQAKVLKEKHIKFQLSLTGRLEQSVSAIIFNAEQRHFDLAQAKTAQFFYQMDINSFRGEASLQLIVRDIFA